ncbi:hypothetical protein HDU98_006913 [Podochytrium sp. JEL0797]|nr:hypothetical protein HDU98_006913 [Podochytrium sp. JEL0797]
MRLAASEAALAKANELLGGLTPAFSPSPVLSLQDPLMEASITDWILASQFMAHMPYQLLSFNDPFFINNFHTEPASLRFIVCAHACLHTNPPMSKHITIDYYNRARKAIKRESFVPVEKHIRSCLLLSEFCRSNGHPILAEPYFQKSVRSALENHLDVDPDDSAWLQPLQLTESEKERRRQVFWIVYFITKQIQIFMSKRILPANIDGTRVRFCKKPFTTNLVAELLAPETATICYLSRILDITHEITTHHTQSIPRTVSEIIFSTVCESMRARLRIVKAGIPSRLILSDCSPHAFHEFTATFSDQEILIDCLFTTLYFNSTVCLLNRPTLYLTKFLSPDSPHLSSSPDAVFKISTAVRESITSAHIILSLSSWILHQSDAGVDNAGGKFRARLWKEHAFEVFALFEAVIVLWFATTQTRAGWWTVVPPTLTPIQSPSPPGEGSSECLGVTMELQDRKRVRSLVLDVLRTLRDLEVSLSPATDVVFSLHYEAENFVTPMCACVARMVDEMEDAENGIRDGGAQEGGVSIEMSVMSLTDVEPEVELPYKRDPWTLLGLLGVQVKGGLRWSAYYENSWRELWERIGKE